MSCNQHLRRWGASLMAWILVLSMCAGLVFPAYATAPTDATETTQVTEATDATETTGTTGTTEVTQATDTTEVTEVTEATEATESTESTESTETTEVTESEDLTAEEQAQAEAVLTALNALESADQVEAKLAALEEDPEGYAAYYNQALAATQAVRDAYAALNDAQKEIVGDISKLTDLDWLVPRETQDDSNKGQILDTLDGDWAYISEFVIKPDDTTESGLALRTGSAPWDSNNTPGNDSSELNNIVRTFDTITYTLQYSTHLRDTVAQQDCGGIKEGRVYFEFLVPGTTTDIRFETGSMGWLETSKGAVYEAATVYLNESPYQILRGSFILTPVGSNEAAIGASTNELTVVLRVLQMSNGETIQPIFTLWLEHNDVGAEYNEAGTIPTSLVYGQNHKCQESGTLPNGSSMAPHDTVEAASITQVPPISVSARAMFNLALVNVDDKNTKVGYYNFNDAAANTINYGLGTVEGRLNGYGLRIELRGKDGQGMRGAELPDTETDITFEIDLFTEFDPSGDLPQAAELDYLPLFWSGGANGENYSGSDNYRPVNTQQDFSSTVPFNSNNDDYSYRNCANGGTWTFNQLENGNIEVTVSGFEFNTNQFPYTSNIGGALSYTYYIPKTAVGGIQNYWDISQAVFSTGILWLLQPFQAVSSDENVNGQRITDKYGTDGMFYTRVEAVGLDMKTASGAQVNAETTTEDNWKESGQYLLQPGRIDVNVAYMRGGTRVWDDALTVGAYRDDFDWATPGSAVTLKASIGHYAAEGDMVGVAYDLLLKFDDEFFVPNPNGTVDIINNSRHTSTILWAALPNDDTTDANPDGWTDDDHMKEATIDDLEYYSSLEALYADNKVPVGVLMETRGVSLEAGQNTIRMYVDGTIRENCKTGQVYMITHCAYAWHKQNTAQQALEYYNTQHDDNPKNNIHHLTDDDYNAYVWNQFPSRANGDTQILSEDHATAGVDYPEPFFRMDYYFTSIIGRVNPDGTMSHTPTSRLEEATKASYANGYAPGVGAPYFQDSCLVVPYITSVTKSVAQEEQTTQSAKAFYDVSRNQRTVDYVIQAKVSRYQGEGTSTGFELDTVIYIEDILPASLKYLSGSAYLGGNYTQDSLHQSRGTVTNGAAFPVVYDDPDAEPDQDNPLLLCVIEENGQTKLLFKIWTTMDLNGVVTLPPIRFSCEIGTPGIEETDVVHDQQIINTVSIWGAADQRLRTASFGNLYTCGITIQKTTAVSLSKISDMLVAELTDDLGFTMNVGNNSAVPKSGTLIAETLPFQGLYDTSFHGSLVVEDFSAAVLDSNGAPIASKFQFYYTTEKDYAGWLSDDFAAQAAQEGKTLAQWLTGDTWQPLTFSGTTAQVNGLDLYPAANLPTVTGTYADGTPKQITAIVALGDLPPNATMKLHITLKLPEGLPGDYLVNYLSQETLSSYARSQIVLRTLEGLAWLDTDKDGIQDSDENKLSGVKVTLKRLEGNAYVPVCYPGTETPITIETGQLISVNAASAAEAAPYEEGRYKFTELPAGTYAVFFESGTTSIEGYTASPINVGDDDALDSDGAGAYSGAALLRTEITGIKMSPVTELPRSGIQVSKHHDSGFYPTAYYELPLTGGMGTGGFTVIGLLLTAAAVLGLAPRKKKKH